MLVEALVAATLGDLDQIGVRAPVLAGLQPLELRSRGLTVPLRPGALAAFGAAPQNPELKAPGPTAKSLQKLGKPTNWR